MISVFASSVVDHGFEPLSGETKYYKIGMCGFSAKHATLFYSASSLKHRPHTDMSPHSDAIF
jgi:hypothetical protein